MTLRQVVNIIRFNSKVEIILQNASVFPDRGQDFTLWINEYTYAKYTEFEKYLNFKVCMLAQKDDYLQIYICKED